MNKELISALYKNAKFNESEARNGRDSERATHEIIAALCMTAATILENKMYQLPTFVPALDLTAPVAVGYIPSALSTLKAAPNLYGYGTTTAGGRGGQIIKVTSTAESGAGTFSEAMQTPGARQIIFDVSGDIATPNVFTIAEGQVSVYGQTAQGDGVYLKGNPAHLNSTMIPESTDMLFQHMRFRKGGVDGNGGSSDAVSIGDSNGADVGNIVFDHCSFSWGVDECMDTAFGAHDIAFNRCMFSEGLYEASSSSGAGTQGYAALISGASNRISMIHCIFSCGWYRFPGVYGALNVDIFNCVMAGYNNNAVSFQAQAGIGVTGNLNDCLFIEVTGNSAVAEVQQYAAVGGAADVRVNVSGNGLQQGANGSPIIAIRVKDSSGSIVDETTNVQFNQSIIATDRPASIPLADLENNLIADCGATKPARDSADTRILAEMVARDMPYKSVVGGYAATLPSGGTNGHLVGTDADVPWPIMASGPSRLGLLADSYVPQAWRDANNQAGDPLTTDSNGDGIPDFEDWLAELAAA